ncbi:MAG: aryl-sulfate sulfotransferase [Euryarchaeota archaeon]|nr:aryl-sulfate sulfotransferase [Euryarchaeota archaeon]
MERTINGQILFSPLYGTTTYLIDATGMINHTWSSSYTPGAATYWLDDGTILRTIRTELAGGGGAGGGVQKIQWDGTIVWDFRYDTNGDLSHHDIYPLTNGNVLMIAWETKTRTQAIAAGRNPDSILGSTFTPDKIIEVHPTSPSSGSIVWEWHAWDHLIQDYDSSKENYGVVGDHPELIDINFGQTIISTMDWIHVNSIDYNQELDQILISAHNFNEIWVIDHSTTTEEAASHTGGNSGKGGNLLYRWGNPQAYDTGSDSDEKLFHQHDASWIKPGCPGEGNILVFNNGVGRPSGQYSSVDEFKPPVDSNGQYALEPGTSYGPENLIWSYTGTPPTDFFSYYISGAERLTDGNTLICDGVGGKFFEVTPEKVILWDYVNSYPNPSINDVFTIDYIPPEEPPQPEIPDLDCEGEMSWTDIVPGSTLQGIFQVQNSGGANSTLDWEVASFPDWGSWSFTPMSGENLTPQDGKIIVEVSVIAPSQQNTEFDGFIRVENKDNQDDFNLIPIYLKTPVNDFVFQMKINQYLLKQKSFFHQKLYNLD